MRQLYWQMMVTLDGFMEGPDGELDWHVIDEDFRRYTADLLGSIDAIVLGRVTWQVLARYWPTAADPEAAVMNALPKLVVSRTLERAEWANSRIVRDAAEEIAQWKRQPGKDLALLGSAQLGAALLRLGLIDELRIFVCPVALGRGRPMFSSLEERTALKLAEAKALGSGVVQLSYRP